MSDRIDELLRLTHEAPDDDAAWYKLGKACIKEGEVEEAIRAFSRATRLNPENWSAHRDLGRALLQAGRARDAVRALRLGVELARKRGEPQTVRGMELLIQRAAREV